MLAIVILILLPQKSFAELQLGTLNNYFTIDEMTNITKILKVTYPLYTSNSTIQPAIGLRCHQVFSSSSFEYFKILILGGFKAGFPMSAYEVLYVAENILSKFNYGGDETLILNSLIIDFVPVPNQKAYSQMENDYNGSSFEVYHTDLSGNSECTGKDVGVNPDHNFPYKWGTFQDKCSQDYSGEKAMTSAVSKLFTDYANYDFIINFQNIGMKYYTPFASKKDMLDQNSEFFYGEILKNTPKTYTQSSMFNDTSIENTGTLLDSAFDKGTFTLQIAIENTADLPQGKIDSEAKLHYNFITTTLKNHFSSINATYLKTNETVDNDSDFYSTFHIVFQITNSRPQSTKFAFQISLNFDNKTDFEYNSTLKSTRKLYEKKCKSVISVKNATIQGSTINLSEEVPLFTEFNLSLVFHKISADVVNNFSADYKFEPSDGSYFFKEITASQVYMEIQPDQESTPETKSPLTPFVLIVIFSIIIILVIYFGVLRGKKNPLLQNN